MPSIPNRPNMPGGGWRQQRAAQLRAEAEAEERIQRAPAEGQAGLGDDRMHCVQEGESLESIADSYDCSPESIRNHPKNAQLSAQNDDAGTLTPGDNVYIPTEDEQPPQPVGQGEHVVQQDECISSIAKDTGHFWETIWNDPANTELKEIRKNPHVLLPGDRVTVPDLRRKEEPRETEQRHRFVRRGEPSVLRLRIFTETSNTPPSSALSDTGIGDRTDSDTARFSEPDPTGGNVAPRADGYGQSDDREDAASEAGQRVQRKPRANTPFTLEIDGETSEGVTDANGCLEVLIPGNARSGKLCVGEGDDQAEYALALGGVAPITELTGVQHRLNNLNTLCGEADGQLGPSTRSALRRFQQQNGLDETGDADQATRNKLVQEHGF